MAQTLQYLQENNLLEYEQLAERTEQAADRFHALSDNIKVIEMTAHTNADLMAATVDYAKTRAVFEEYKAAKYSRSITRSMRPILNYTGRHGPLSSIPFPGQNSRE